ncbi:MAG: hypothetical protein KatS3mg053_2572 [Candidatus Roseilinea sp.]|nr:MAG: hypothetical protein KatS3mg053_2572 [Candidatus Roseilinea sp.]
MSGSYQLLSRVTRTVHIKAILEKRKVLLRDVK